MDISTAKDMIEDLQQEIAQLRERIRKLEAGQPVEKTFAQQVDETVRDVVAMVNQGTANPNVVYPPGRYQGD